MHTIFYKCHDKHSVSNYLFLFSQLHRFQEGITIFLFYLLKLFLVFFFYTKFTEKKCMITVNANLFIYYNSMWTRELSLLLPFSCESSHTCTFFLTKYSQTHCFLSLLDLLRIVECRSDGRKRSKSRRLNMEIEIIDYQ